MQLKTLLNRVYKLKSFVYGEIRFMAEPETVIEIEILPRKGSRPVCSGCGRKGPVYDHLEPRRFRFVPLWAIPVIFVYRMRRVDCLGCGAKVETVPWAEGKSPLTRPMAFFLSDWAKLLSWQDVARRFGVNWRQVFESHCFVVEWGLKHRDISGVTAIGIDEVQFGKGQQYLTVIYQLCGDVRRLLFVTRRRDAAALESGIGVRGSGRGLVRGHFACLHGHVAGLSQGRQYAAFECGAYFGSLSYRQDP